MKCNTCDNYGFLTDDNCSSCQRVEDLKSRLQIEHDNYLSVHRDNMKLLDRNMDLKNCLQVAVDALGKAVDALEISNNKIDELRVTVGIGSLVDLVIANKNIIAKIREPK